MSEEITISETELNASPNGTAVVWVFSLLPARRHQLPQLLEWRLRALQVIWGITPLQAAALRAPTADFLRQGMASGTYLACWAVRSSAAKKETSPSAKEKSPAAERKSLSAEASPAEERGLLEEKSPAEETKSPAEEASPAEEEMSVSSDAVGDIIGCVGLLLYREFPSPDNATGRCAFVTNLFVSPQARHHGVGYALMNWATQEARRRQCGKIFLEVNPPAQGIFSALGYQPMDGYLRLPADEEP